MVETGFFEIRDRAPWPAEAGEKADLIASTVDESRNNENEERVRHGRIRKPRPETVRFQGMRMGYFCVDKDTKHDDIILNRIVTLKEDSGKG